MAFQFPSDLEVLFFPHHQPEVPIWTHDSDDNDSHRSQTAPRANPRSTGLALEQNGLLTTPWILGRLVPCGVRQNRVPSPDTQSWGTSAQRRGIRHHLSRVGRVSRRLLDSYSTHPNRQHNSREPVLVGRRQDQNKPPIGPGRAPVNRRRRVSGGGWETVRWRQNLLRIQTSASIRLCDGETQWPGVCGIPST